MSRRVESKPILKLSTGLTPRETTKPSKNHGMTALVLLLPQLAMTLDVKFGGKKIGLESIRR